MPGKRFGSKCKLTDGLDFDISGKFWKSNCIQLVRIKIVQCTKGISMNAPIITNRCG